MYSLSRRVYRITNFHRKQMLRSNRHGQRWKMYCHAQGYPGGSCIGFIDQGYMCVCKVG
ncbi:hypothetical protein AtEden1_Chr1g0070501 [Arabidopsis thaliana]